MTMSFPLWGLVLQQMEDLLIGRCGERRREVMSESDRIFSPATPPSRVT